MKVMPRSPNAPTGPLLSCYELAHKGQTVMINQACATADDPQLWEAHKDDLGLIRSWYIGPEKLVYVWFVQPINGPCGGDIKAPATGPGSSLVHADEESCEHAIRAAHVSSCIKLTDELEGLIAEAIMKELGGGNAVSLVEGLPVKQAQAALPMTEQDYLELFDGAEM